MLLLPLALALACFGLGVLFVITLIEDVPAVSMWAERQRLRHLGDEARHTIDDIFDHAERRQLDRTVEESLFRLFEEDDE